MSHKEKLDAERTALLGQAVRSGFGNPSALKLALPIIGPLLALGAYQYVGIWGTIVVATLALLVFFTSK